MFQFNYFNEKTDTEVIKNYFFDFINKSDSEIQALYDKWLEGPGYDEFLSDMEEYGTHDYFGDDVILHGFESAEVNPARYNTVVKRWKRYFTDVVGLESGPIYIIDGPIDNTGPDVE